MNQAPVVVEEVLRFEDLPVGSMASRRAVVRWSDGTESEALRWFDEEVLVSEGDLVGKTREQIRSLHFRRDRDWLGPDPGQLLDQPQRRSPDIPGVGDRAGRPGPRAAACCPRSGAGSRRRDRAARPRAAVQGSLEHVVARRPSWVRR